MREVFRFSKAFHVFPRIRLPTENKLQQEGTSSCGRVTKGLMILKENSGTCGLWAHGYGCFVYYKIKENDLTEGYHYELVVITSGPGRCIGYIIFRRFGYEVAPGTRLVRDLTRRSEKNSRGFLERHQGKSYRLPVFPNIIRTGNGWKNFLSFDARRI